MSESIWQMFPYPTLADGEFAGGALMGVHPDCVACPTRACVGTNARQGEVRHCRYGLSFAKVDEDRLVVGVVENPASGNVTSAMRRRFKEKDRHARPEQLRRSIEVARSLGPGVSSDFIANRDAMLQHLAQDEQMQQYIAEHLRRGFDDNVAQSHDFMQLVKLVRGHAEALLKERHPSLSPEDAADTEPAIGAIYYSTSLMIVKLDALVYLNEINRAFGREREFRLHPLILKYIRIYLWQAKQKGVHITLGSTYATCFYDGAAVGAVVQGLLDNMVKYAPANSRATIRFVESDGAIRVEFISLGPKIAQRELREIFLAGIRGQAARDNSSEGQGIGLATVKAVSDALDLHIEVTQAAEADRSYDGSYQTVFSITLNTD